MGPGDFAALAAQLLPDGAVGISRSTRRTLRYSKSACARHACELIPGASGRNPVGDVTEAGVAYLNVDSTALHLSRLAVAALLDEAELTPKPAHVDGRGNGAHHDLDLARLRRSALAFRGGFAAIARAAAGEKSLHLRAE